MWAIVVATLSATCVHTPALPPFDARLSHAAMAAGFQQVLRSCGVSNAADGSSSQTATATAPTAYSAISDRYAYPEPPLPQLGPAGFTFRDPVFGSRLMRVTDGDTRPGIRGRSYRVPSNAHLAAWNADSTRFIVVSDDGTIVPFAFDASSLTARRIQPTTGGNGGLTLGFYVEPQFSLIDPGVIYGITSGANSRTVAAYNFATGLYTTVVDLDSVVGGLANTYVGGIMTGGTGPENLMVFFGGAAQDLHYYALWAPVRAVGARKIVNTLASTVNGVSTNVALNFRIHSAQIDKSGRFVFLYPTVQDLGSPRYASQVYLWDTATDRFTAVTSAMHPGGHDAAGYGYWVNQDCCTSSSWDAMQWQFRYLSDPTRTNDLISPVLSPKEIYAADHTTWNNARPDAMVPVISSAYRTPNNTTAWRAWDDEIIGIDTTGGIGGVVYRFAHHRSNIASDADPSMPYFWYEPIANVSPDGRWVLFTSNWEKTLGRDTSQVMFRQDVFLVELVPGTSGTAPVPSPSPSPSPSPEPSPTASPTPTAPGPTAAPNETVPLAPQSLTSRVVGSTVSLSWNAPTGGSAVAAYVIEAGSASGKADLAQLVTAATTTELVVPGVAPGAYHVRVRGRNDVGAGPSSNEIVVVVDGATNTGGAPSDLSAVVDRSTVTLRWTAGAATGTGFLIEAGSAPGLRDLAAVTVPSGATVFTASNVGAGLYYVRVRTLNGSTVGPSSNEIALSIR